MIKRTDIIIKLTSALLLVFIGVHALIADGTIEGKLSVDLMKPSPSRPGYLPSPTKHPVLKPESAPAIVYLERDDGQYPRLKTNETVQIRQFNYQFRPSMVAIQTGAKIDFPNLDDEFHNVFSCSKAKHFDLGRFRKDEISPDVLFNKPGVVKIYCEIHQHMRCFVVVLDTPWFVKTDPEGKFSLNNIPAGEYWLRIFQPSERRIQERVTVMDGQTNTLNFTR